MWQIRSNIEPAREEDSVVLLEDQEGQPSGESSDSDWLGGRRPPAASASAAVRRGVVLSDSDSERTSSPVGGYRVGNEYVQPRLPPLRTFCAGESDGDESVHQPVRAALQRRRVPLGIDLEAALSGSDSGDDSGGSGTDLSCITDGSGNGSRSVGTVSTRRTALSAMAGESQGDFSGHRSSVHASSDHGHSSHGSSHRGRHVEPGQPASRKRVRRPRAPRPARGGSASVGGTRPPRGPDNSRYRHWCWTLNNWTAADWVSLEVVAADSGVSYLCFQPERGEDTGTPHLQGFISLKNTATLSAVRARLGPRFHLEVMRATNVDDAINYCCKPDTADLSDPSRKFVEFGVRPRGGVGKTGGRSDLLEIADAIKAGKSELELFELFPAAFLRNYRGIAHVISLRLPKRNFKTLVVWCYGSTGTGKTRFVEREVFIFFQ